jgi:hypothetical protein
MAQVAQAAHEAWVAALLNVSKLSRGPSRAALSVDQRCHSSTSLDSTRSRQGGEPSTSRWAHKAALKPVSTVATSQLRFAPIHQFYWQQDNLAAAIRANKARAEAKLRKAERSKREQLARKGADFLTNLWPGADMAASAGVFSDYYRNG